MYFQLSIISRVILVSGFLSVKPFLQVRTRDVKHRFSIFSGFAFSQLVNVRHSKKIFLEFKALCDE